jgi:hypothetical protein
MTYQIVLSGKDGVVIASDQKELLSPSSAEMGEGYKPNMVTKLRVDSSGTFAWAFAGGMLSAAASAYFERTLENRPSGPVHQILRDCCDRAWKENAKDPEGSVIILVDGPKREILRAKICPMTVIESMHGGRCFSGQTFNAGSFVARRFYRQDMSVVELASLAAFTIKEAHEADTVCVDGLDPAVYQNSTGQFCLVKDTDRFWQHAERLHTDIIEHLRSTAIPLEV